MASNRIGVEIWVSGFLLVYRWGSWVANNDGGALAAGQTTLEFQWVNCTILVGELAWLGLLSRPTVMSWQLGGKGAGWASWGYMVKGG